MSLRVSPKKKFEINVKQVIKVRLSSMKEDTIRKNLPRTIFCAQEKIYKSKDGKTLIPNNVPHQATPSRSATAVVSTLQVDSMARLAGPWFPGGPAIIEKIATSADSAAPSPAAGQGVHECNHPYNRRCKEYSPRQSNWLARHGST
jgi:hypothetical protein